MKSSSNPQNLLAREWMQLALLKLIQSKELHDVTISELTKIAGVSRTTFYRNYDDISDILFDYLEMTAFGLAGKDPNEKYYLPYFIRNYFKFFKEHKVMLACIYQNHMSDRFSSLLEKHLNTNIYSMISGYGFESHYEISALVGMLAKILKDWFKSGMKESVEDMTKITYNIITKFSCLESYF